MTADLIDALTELSGVTITVRHPLHDAAQRLMDTLGVTVVIDPSAPPCVAFAGKHNTSVKPDGCAKCREMHRKADWADWVAEGMQA